MDRDFKGIWIPKEIWLCDELSPTEMFIAAEIDSLDRGEGNRCYASNEYLAQRCHCSESKVTRAITKLISMGLIEKTGSNGRTRYLKSNISQQKAEADSELFRSRVGKKPSQNQQKSESDSADCRERNIKENTNREKDADASCSSGDESRQKSDLQKERFDRFWDAYPRKVGKRAAEKSWKRIKVTDALYDQIMRSLASAKHTSQWQRNNGQFIPNPATWLNQGRWEDDVGTYDKAVGGSESDRIAAALLEA